MDTNAFDILSNEVISHSIAYLDAVSLFRFCGCSKRLLEFNNISNEHWQILYSIQWLVDEQELRLYGDKDWKQYFKSRYTLENNLMQKPVNVQPHEVHPGSLLRSRTAAEIITALDAIDKIWVQNTYDAVGIFVTTALLKLIRTNELPMNRVDSYLLFLGNNIVFEAKSELIGIYSVAEKLLDPKYSASLPRTLKLLTNAQTHNDGGVNTYPALMYRLLDVIEKSSSLEITRFAMAACNFAADITNRPVICQKICQAIDQCLVPELDLPTLSRAESLVAIKEFIIRLVPNNGEFMVAQGVLEKLFAVVPKLDEDPEWFFHVMSAIEEFAYDESIAKQIVKNELVLTSILDHAKYLRNNVKYPDEELTIFDAVLSVFYALIYSRTVEHLFYSPYLEYVLPYLERDDLGEGVLGNICVTVSQYVRHGIETLRLRSIYKRIEPYLQTIIDSPDFKYSITLWQTLYCGMKLPLDMAKSLIERIIPELPLETDKRVKRSYSELLSNMVQVDRTPFLDIDMKLLYDYYSKELIIDDRTKDPSTRSKVPIAGNFIAAGAFLPQFAELAIKDEKLLEKMYSLYDEQKEVKETIYLVAIFFANVVKIPGWDNRKGLELLERWGTTMPLDAPMYYMFTMLDYFMHFFARDNPVEVLCFATWIIARMSQRQDGRDALKPLSSDTIEWLSSHPDPRLRKNMESYHQNMYRAEMGYVDEY